MNTRGYFDECCHGPWITGGLDVQYKVKDRVLYFQATRSKSDWLHNLSAWRHVYTASVIQFDAHAGFADMWLSVQKEIEKLEFDIIVGYSEGAALAGFAHENYFHRNGFEPATFAFGCPRFLYKPSKELLRRFTRFVRIKNQFDIVTFVPPSIFGYRHAGIEVITKSVKKPDGHPTWEWLSGHSPEQYRLALEE